ncbi:MAG: hypothetical protein RL684_2376 [Pseudomonadota bacterium]|jgi:predicted MFS family arabinose efflux permease
MDNNASTARVPGFAQGLFLLLPITLAVIGVSVFTATVHDMQVHFAGVAHGDIKVNFLQGMPGFWIVAFSPVAGWLADKFGRRTILLWSMAVYAIAGTAPFGIESINTILVTRCFVGMCESVILTVTTTMLCDYFKGAARERWLASQTGVASLSALVIIPLGGILGAHFGWQGPFLVYLYSLPLMVLVWLYCWEPAHEAPSADEVAKVDADAIYQSIPWGRMVGIMAITLVGSMFFYSTITQSANALAELNVVDQVQVTKYVTAASLGVPIGTLLFWVLARLQIGWLLFIDFLLIGLGFAWMSKATDPWTFVLAADLQQIGCGLILPTLLVWATRGLAYRVRGRGNGLWQGAFGLGLFFSGAMIQVLGKLLGGSKLAAFGLLGELSLAAAVLALLAKFIWGRKALPLGGGAPGGH